MDGGFGTAALVAPGSHRGALAVVCTRLDTGPRYQVRRYQIEPGAALPPCHHLHRAEHWTVVQGTARVTRDGQSALFSEGLSFHVTLGQTHAVENPGRIPLILIEVWTGSYLGEDDVIVDFPAPAMP